MTGPLRKLQNYFSAQPKKLFLFDALGALVTTFFMILLAAMDPLAGIPEPILMNLSMGAMLLTCYSFICWYLNYESPAVLIFILAGANLTYCLITFILVLMHNQSVTLPGWVYFGLEWLIISVLVTVEYKVARNVKAGFQG